MKNPEPADLSAVQVVRLIAKGSLTSETLMRSCLERIVQREPEVQAFEHLEIDRALAEVARGRHAAITQTSAWAAICRQG